MIGFGGSLFQSMPKPRVPARSRRRKSPPRPATGALTIAQAVRLASLESAPHFLQMELGAPEMTTLRGLTAAPESKLGSLSVRL
jgi:hypothetical protein